MPWAVSLQAVLTWFTGYLRYALPRRDQGTGADPHPQTDFSENFISTETSPTQGGQESKSVILANRSPRKLSDKVTEPSQKRPLGLLYSIHLEDRFSDRWFYSAKGFPGLRHYMAAEEDDEPLALFEMTFDLKGNPKKGAAMKTMDKKDFDQVEDFINLERDFMIRTQHKPALRINALGVISAFRYLIKYDPYQSMAGNQMVLFWGESWSYPSWYHNNLVELQRCLSEGRPTGYVASDRAKDLSNNDTANQIGQLLDIMTPYHEKYVLPEWELHNMSPPLATFERLRLLFVPGKRVYTKVGSELAGFIVTSARYEKKDDESRTRDAGKRVMYVYIWNYRYVGGKVVRHGSRVLIEEFKDQREITLLPIFPSSVYDTLDDGNLRRRLESRGKKYYDMIKTKFAHKDHHGRTLDSKPVEYHGDIIVDPITYASRQDRFSTRDMDPGPKDVNYDPLALESVSEPRDFGGGELWKNFDDFDPSIDRKYPLDERHFFLFPKKIPGMSLKYKQWCIFDIDAISDIDWPAPDDAMKQIILSKEQESLLLANCRDEESVRQSPDWVADSARQKGAGKLFLLHGPPGTGKTLTVECIAKYLKQPLLSLSVADIGISPRSESNLERWLALAMHWKAIVLIDEADVFMTHRGGHLEDTILVSTFLRTVEYYTGIMFLTTNRPGQMDTALHSRVQVPIKYDYLKRADRENICKSLFATFKNTVPRVKYEQQLEECLLQDEIMDLELNARELRNAFQLAVALARENSVYISGGVRYPSDEIKLTLVELRRAFKVRQDYNMGTKKIHDKDASALAYQRGELPKHTADKSVPDAEDDPMKPEPED